MPTGIIMQTRPQTLLKIFPFFIEENGQPQRLGNIEDVFLPGIVPLTTASVNEKIKDELTKIGALPGRPIFLNESLYYVQTKTENGIEKIVFSLDEEGQQIVKHIDGILIDSISNELYYFLAIDKSVEDASFSSLVEEDRVQYNGREFNGICEVRTKGGGIVTRYVEVESIV
uniref:Uncharacterized protein n=1 Tax=Roseihalotalea indica TaxID=2867963 RepID=A0AA49GIW1_9BACT|nr:hypothetical protein K4G66_17100 [Tunicatimonas sp. TK19036]